MDRQEVYEHIVGALEAEFTSGEFGEGEFVVQAQRRDAHHHGRGS